ncbi:MAG: hypothetical protein ABI207_05590 [Crocinitomicaceae bacterium]
MIRQLFIITTILFIISACGQNSIKEKKNSSCYKYMLSSENEYFCDTTVFTNGSKLYYQWNCDSTWLTFENKEKIILKSCLDSDPILCSRIGLNFIKEYPNYLLFVYKWASSGSWSPDLVFIDKENVQEKNRISSGQFVWGDTDENYALYFSDTTFSELIYLDHESDKEYMYLFKDNEVLNSIKKNKVIQLNDLFKDIKKTNELLTFNFINENNKTEQITIKIQ